MTLVLQQPDGSSVASLDLTNASALTQNVFGTRLLDIFPNAEYTTQFNPESALLALTTLRQQAQVVAMGTPTGNDALLRPPEHTIRTKRASELSPDEEFAMAWRQDTTVEGEAFVSFSMVAPQPLPGFASQPMTAEQQQQAALLQDALDPVEQFLQAAARQPFTLYNSAYDPQTTPAQQSQPAETSESQDTQPLENQPAPAEGEPPASSEPAAS